MCNQQSVGGRLDVKYDGVLIDEVEYCDYALTELKKTIFIRNMSIVM